MSKSRTNIQLSSILVWVAHLNPRLGLLPETRKPSYRQCAAWQEQILFFDTARGPSSHDYCRECLQNLFPLINDRLFPLPSLFLQTTNHFRWCTNISSHLSSSSHERRRSWNSITRTRHIAATLTSLRSSARMTLLGREQSVRIVGSRLVPC